MSEEVAQAIGGVLAENERLKQQVAQAEERARIASAAYHQQQDRAGRAADDRDDGG